MPHVSPFDTSDQNEQQGTEKTCRTKVRDFFVYGSKQKKFKFYNDNKHIYYLRFV